MIMVFLLMVLCHIVDDFVLQPVCLSKLKQKVWWEENAPDGLYRNDYKVALLIHSVSWSIMIMLPFMIYGICIPEIVVLTVFVVNSAVHCLVDDLKANKRKINLLTDQSVHFLQILITYAVLCICS